MPTELHPHLQRLHDALRVEEAAVADEHRRLDALPFDEQIAQGHAWPEVRIRGTERMGRSVRVLATPPRGVELHDGISVGAPVWFAAQGSTWTGWVESTDGRHAEVRVDGDEPADGAIAAIRCRHDPSTFVRYRQALEKADAHRSDLRRVLLGDREPPAISARAALPGLNEAQQRAAGAALRAPELGLVHGPPGTGKTTLLAAMLGQLVEDGDRPWALADSNAAVDNLALAAAARGLEVVRLGPVGRFRPEARPLSLEARLRAGPLGPALTTLERDLKRAWGTAEGNALFHERERLRDQAKAHAIAQAEVVATTFGTLARLAETLPRPSTAVVDEATQAIEPAVWAAVPYVERLILVGDPEQLGPVVKSRDRVLGVSLLERLVDRGLPMPMLTEQHRMVSRIRTLVDDVYGATYVDAPGTPAGDDGSVIFVDTAGAGGEERDPATGSLFEPAEIEAVGKAVEALRTDGFPDSEIAVITPYSAQAKRLRDLLPAVAVGTVNAFQGREARAVVVSFVRSNPDGELGFLTDERRLTVALTRAKERLVLVGDSGTLARNDRYARLIDRIAAGGGLRSVWE